MASPSIFREQDYKPFMMGVFVLGGLVAIPLLWGPMSDVSYVKALPWSVLSCLVVLAAFRKNGTISWPRFIGAALVAGIAGGIYAAETNQSGFIAGGVVGYAVVVICGKIGVLVHGKVIGKSPAADGESTPPTSSSPEAPDTEGKPPGS